MPLTIHVSLEGLVARVKSIFRILPDHLSRPRCRSYIQLRQAGGVEAPERETFEGGAEVRPNDAGRRWGSAPIGCASGRRSVSTIQPADGRRDGGDGGKRCRVAEVAVFKRTSDMLTGIINEIVIICRWWQEVAAGRVRKRGRHTGGYRR